jgi:GNAT superfamily N-acetyltransferase
LGLTQGRIHTDDEAGDAVLRDVDRAQESDIDRQVLGAELGSSMAAAGTALGASVAASGAEVSDVAVWQAETVSATTASTATRRGVAEPPNGSVRMATVCKAARPRALPGCYPPPMLPRDVVIRDLRPAEQERAAGLMASAFLDFPAMRLVVGSGGGARDRLKRLFAMEFEPGSPVTAIAADVDGRLVGTLTYLDSPACSEMSPGRMLRFARIAGPRIVRAVRMFSRIDRVHPSSAHRHLPSIAVLPELQSQGIGRRLMEVFHERADTVGRPAYLETIRWSDTSRPSLERFYIGLGYDVADEIPMTEEWSVLTMVRPGRGRSEPG